VLTHKYFAGRVPECGELQDVDREALAAIPELKASLEHNLDTYHFREALKDAMGIARVGNKYISDTEPWKVAKTDMARCATILNISLQICADLAIAFEPFTPFAAERLRRMLDAGLCAGTDHRKGEQVTVNTYREGEGAALHTSSSLGACPDAGKEVCLNWARLGASDLLPVGHAIGEPELLFAKIEDDAIDAQLARLQAIRAEKEAEAINASEKKVSSDWERLTKEIIDLQAEWKTIGFAPQKMNVKIFERFRAACDTFFAQKAEFFKTLKDTFKENAEKKRALIEKAKALQDSTEWKSTSDKLINLQKEWKTIGMVPKKLGDQLWEEFLGACNKFFEARNAATAGTRGEEQSNLEKKRDVIARLKAAAEEAGDNIQEKVQQLVSEYQAIGHVPFREKDKVYEEYHAVLDKLYKELNVSVAKKRLNNFKQNLKQVAERGENALDNERARLFRQYEAIKQEVQTYENNLGFLNASSKKGNSLIDEMNRKVQKLKDDMNLVREKIKAIDAENK
jgi:hypothetical protein